MQRAGGVHFSPHKSGSSLALRTPPRPVVAGARSSQAAPPARAPRAFHHRPRPAPSFAKLRTPASGTGFVPQPVPAAPALRLLRTTSAVAFVASALVSRSCLAVAAAPLLSRHPPHKKLWAVESCEAVASIPPKLFPGPRLDNCSLAACGLVLVFLQKTSCACLVKRWRQSRCNLLRSLLAGR